MKKYVLILFFFLTTIISGAQGNIKTYGVFETGYESRQTMIYTSEYERFVLGILPTYVSGPYFGKLSMGATYKGFNLYVSDKTFFNKDRSIYFNPQVIEYKIGASYTHKSITFGYEHKCAHSVEAVTYSESYDRAYVRIKLFGNPNF
jgi:hypothetical protein